MAFVFASHAPFSAAGVTKEVPSTSLSLDAYVKVDGKDTRVVPIGKQFTVTYSVYESYKESIQNVNVSLKLYSDGVLVQSKSIPNVKAKGAKSTFPMTVMLARGKKNYGPYLLCLSFQDSFGNQTLNAPCSKSRWYGIEVPIALVSNGCGGQTGIKRIDSWEKTLLDKQETHGAIIDFKQACNAHDAGYSGFTIKYPYYPYNLIDYLLWSRQMVDDQFLVSLNMQCILSIGKAKISESNRADAYNECQEFAATYYAAVRAIGFKFYDANPVKEGVQTEFLKLRPDTFKGGPESVGFARNNK